MFEKMKDIGSQVATKANDAIEGMTTSVKGGVAQPVSLKATVNIGIASLEMEIQVPPAAKTNGPA